MQYQIIPLELGSIVEREVFQSGRTQWFVYNAAMDASGSQIGNLSAKYKIPHWAMDQPMEDVATGYAGGQAEGARVAQGDRGTNRAPFPRKRQSLLRTSTLRKKDET